MISFLQGTVKGATEGDGQEWDLDSGRQGKVAFNYMPIGLCVC